MVLIKWHDEFQSGIPEIDRDHKALINGINDLWRETAVSWDRRNVVEFLGNVHEHVSEHFSREEDIMKKHDYDQYAEHKAEHLRLLEEISDIQNDYAEAFNDYDPEQMLAKRVTAWFTDHIRNHDVRLHKFVG